MSHLRVAPKRRSGPARRPRFGVWQCRGLHPVDVALIPCALLAQAGWGETHAAPGLEDGPVDMPAGRWPEPPPLFAGVDAEGDIGADPAEPPDAIVNQWAERHHPSAAHRPQRLLGEAEETLLRGAIDERAALACDAHVHVRNIGRSRRRTCANQATCTNRQEGLFAQQTVLLDGNHADVVDEV